MACRARLVGRGVETTLNPADGTWGATLDQYDQITELMGLTPGGPTPPGAIFHWAAKTDDGLRVVDVWESKEVFDRFAQEQIGPCSQQVGIPVPPETTCYDVHNTLS